MNILPVHLFFAFFIIHQATCNQVHQAEPLHVLFFLVDDLGYADVGYHGNKVGSAILTPTIDSIAATGVKLENYYVNQLCSPTRSSLLSGRYAYSISMNGEVIVDGSTSCMPTSVKTIADRLHDAGWATSAYGKWDLGSYHFYGFYNAANNYFTHHVGAGLDFRDDTKPVRDKNGSYFTEIITENAINWLRNNSDGKKPTFVYMAHESNHGPMQVPLSYVNGHCSDSISASRPARRIVCGMMRAVDKSLSNLTNTYKELGVWSKTIIIFSTDNGGETDTGGNNFPLRGNKATMWEGGVRGVGFVGGGFPPVNKGSVSKSMIHVSDWYPSIVHGIAKLPIGVPADGFPALDGFDAWPSIVDSIPSNRTEMLLWLNTHQRPTADGAIRIGKYKLIQKNSIDRSGAPLSPTHSDIVCTPRDQQQTSLGLDGR
eukprot:UC4_evm3s436